MIVDGQRAIVDIGYLLATLFVIFGLQAVGVPRTARRGVRMVALGLLVAVVVTFVSPGLEDTNVLLIIVGLLLGGGAGAVIATRVSLDDVDGYAGLFGGFAALATGLVALSDFLRFSFEDRIDVSGLSLAVVLGGFATGTGLTGFLRSRQMLGEPVPRPTRLGQIQIAIGIVVIAALIAVILLETGTLSRLLLVVLLMTAIAMGSLACLALPAAQVSVVPAVLGVAVGPALILTGLAMNQEILIVFGALATAAGVLLIRQAARATPWTAIEMTIAGLFGVPAGTGRRSGRGGGQGLPQVREMTPEDAAIQLAYAKSVVIVPGYGIAVAQAHHVLRSLADLLVARGVQVRFAVHPTAGRVPGQIAMLLTEANVALADLRDLGAANEDLTHADVALVVGASDIINPAARDDDGPLSGLPVLDVDQAGAVIVLKRSLRPGYSGVENDVLRAPRTSLVFGDARESLARLIGAIQVA